MLELDFPGEIRDNEKIDIKILSEILKNPSLSKVLIFLSL